MAVYIKRPEGLFPAATVAGTTGPEGPPGPDPTWYLDSTDPDILVVPVAEDAQLDPLDPDILIVSF